MFSWLQCVGKAMFFKGGKALLNFVGSQKMGDLLFEDLPEVAQDALACLKRKSPEEQREALERMVQASDREVANEAEQIVSDVVTSDAPGIPKIPPEQAEAVQEALLQYLTRVPAAVRRSLSCSADPTGKTVSKEMLPQSAEDVLPMLPASFPRYKPGDYPIAGIDLELVEPLGIGGFGEVWKAVNPHMASDPPVALKICLDAHAAKFLRNETAILAHVRSHGKHPGIVQLQRTYLRADPPCLEYELIEGTELTNLIKERHRDGSSPDPLEVASLIVQIASTVGYAHRLDPPIVHRDLKPSNILIEYHPNNEYKVKVADFGIGAISANREVQKSCRGVSQAQYLVTAVRGSHTPLYASSGQMRGKDPHPRDDVHALGVMWYQILVGDLMSGGPKGSRWKTKLVDRGMTQDLVELLGSCLEEDPEDQPRDCAVVAEEVARCLEAQHDTTASNVEAPQPKKTSPSAPQVVPKESARPTPVKKSNRSVSQIEFNCPNCGSSLKVSDRHTGKKVRCPHCSEVILIPTPSSSDPSQSMKKPSSSASPLTQSEFARNAVSLDKAAMKRLCENYIEHVEAFTQAERVRNKYTGRYEEPDERFMRSLELLISIPEEKKEDFRGEVMNQIGYISMFALDQKRFEYNSNPALLKALTLKLWTDMFDHLRESPRVFDGNVNRLWERYLQNVKGFTQGDQVLDPATGKREPPDESLMHDVEAKMGIAPQDAENYRRDLVSRFANAVLDGKQPSYTGIQGLHKALFLTLLERIELSTFKQLTTEPS